MQLLRHRHLIAAALAHFEPQRHRVLFARRRREARQPRENLSPPLRLLAVLAGEMPPDVILLLVDRFFLLHEGALLLELPVRALLDERGVAAHVRRCAVRLHVENVVADVLEKRAIVADQHHGLVRALEIFLEPSRGLEIEMVRRLVEQQHIRGRHELAREPDAPALAAAQPLERTRARIHRIESESVQHRIDARRDRVAALAIEALEIVRVAIEHLLAHRLAHLAHLRRLIRERLLQRQKLRELSRSGLPHRLRITEVAMLLEQRDPAAPAAAR